jgi:Na+/H+ antiporter NhaD/arsenite permease-like protein
VSKWFDYNIHNVWIVGLISGLLSGLVDSFAIAMTNISMYHVVEEYQLAHWVDADYMSNFVQNGAFWKIVAYTTAVGSCLFCFANASGIALMKMEHVRIGWYLKNCTLKVAAGWLIGLCLLWAEVYFFS